MSDDALEIANLKARYCFAADTSAEDVAAARQQFASMFTDDFRGDYGFAPLQGPQAIIDFMCKAIGEGSEWMIHMLGSPRIRVDGDAASGDWTVRVESRRRESGSLMTVVGRYSDTFRRTPRGWRIGSIAFSRYD